jgi:hypothetical protein
MRRELEDALADALAPGTSARILTREVGLTSSEVMHDDVGEIVPTELAALVVARHLEMGRRALDHHVSHMSRGSKGRGSRALDDIQCEANQTRYLVDEAGRVVLATPAFAQRVGRSGTPSVSHGFY